MLDRRSGPMTFAGRQLSLDNCEAVVGYASDGAYVMVLSGAARLGEARVAAGRMLILPPFGGRPMPEVFDAGRFKAAWSAAAVAGAPRAYSDLVRLERVQRRAVFFGRYQQTAFNVAVSGEAGREAARRVAVGGPAVRALRFGPDASPGVVEQRVVESFIAALTNGDAETAAQLMDPNPFGGSGMGAEGAQARVQFARDLTRERDWRRQLKETVVARAAAGERWLIVGPNGLTVVELRATPDFAFVRSLRVEESR